MSHKRSMYAKQQECLICSKPAYHKVGEEILDDIEIEYSHPDVDKKFTLPRHNWTAYVCCKDFQKIFGLKDCGKMYRSPEN